MSDSTRHVFTSLAGQAKITNPSSCLDVALLARRLGFSPLIPLEDGSKAPARKWQRLETEAALEAEIRGWFRSEQNSIGLVTGFGGLECFEFDDPNTYSKFLEAAAAVGLGDLIARIRAGYEEATPSGGIHWLYVCSELRGNTKLAERPDPRKKNERSPLIETKGRGGFVIIAPSCGRVHASGRPYRLLSGGLDKIVQISDGDRNRLWEFARTFDEMGMTWDEVIVHGVSESSKRPGDEFAERVSWDEILEPAGWKKLFMRDGVTYWQRPGKDGAGYSATTGFCKGFKVFSTSTAFSTQGTHTKFQTYAILNHGGNFTEAARCLGQKGFGHAQPGQNGAVAAVVVREHYDDPHRLARIFLAKRCQHADRTTLVYHRGEFHQWEIASYRPASNHELGAGVTVTTKAEFDRLNQRAVEAWERAGKLDGRGRPCEPPKAQKVTKALVGNVEQALRGITLLSGKAEPPVWLIDQPPFPAADVLPARNALVHLPGFVESKAGAIREPSPNYFGTYALDYDFNPLASAPTGWTAFLRSVWPSDDECIECLQEWMGYLLTPDTSHQKIGVLIGPTRSGRGTISRVIRGLVGACNVASPTFSGLSAPFGAACLVGKPVAIIGDARVSYRSDMAVALERLLMISGEDAIEIDRKHQPAWEGRLPTRIMLISNELPRIHDTSGALAARFLLFPFTESFLGREDKSLDRRLEAELPGILLWAIAGWKRLRLRGAFEQPASGREMIAQMHDLSSPVGAYIRDRVELGAGYRERTADVFADWKNWCLGKNREPGDEATFGRNLRTVIPTLVKAQVREGSGRVNYYEGLQIKGVPY